MEETSNDLMAETPVNPMEAKIQRGRRRIQKTPQKFSQFCFADGDDKFRPFLNSRQSRRLMSLMREFSRYLKNFL